jgi:hypothetical protein
LVISGILTGPWWVSEHFCHGLVAGPRLSSTALVMLAILGQMAVLAPLALRVCGHSHAHARERGVLSAFALPVAAPYPEPFSIDASGFLTSARAG